MKENEPKSPLERFRELLAKSRLEEFLNEEEQDEFMDLNDLLNSDTEPVPVEEDDDTRPVTRPLPELRWSDPNSVNEEE